MRPFSRTSAANRRRQATAMVLTLLWLRLATGAPAESPIQFTDVTAQTGITFEHKDGSSGQ